MRPSIELSFNLEEAGWANLVIKVDGEIFVIDSISYLSNALDDLLRSGLDIATDKGYSWVVFDHEPATSILMFETGWWEGTSWATGGRLSVFEGDGLGGSDPTWQNLHHAEPKFRSNAISRDLIASSILRSGEDVLQRYGTDGYSQRWNGQLPFPVRAMTALRAALSIPALNINDSGR